MSTGEFNAGGSPAMDQYPTLRAETLLPGRSCCRNPDKLQTGGHLVRMQIRLHAESKMAGEITLIDVVIKLVEQAQPI